MTVDSHGFRGRIGGLEYTSDDLIILWGEEHRQHVVHRRQAELSIVSIEHRKIAEMAIRVGDQGAEGADETHHLQGLRIDAPIPMKPHCRCDPVIEHPVLRGVDRQQRRDADSAVQTQTIKSIQLEKRHSFKLLDLRACGRDPAATQHLVCQMFGDEEIRPALAHCRIHRRRKFHERMLIIITATK